jgi:hypothetical protein
VHDYLVGFWRLFVAVSVCLLFVLWCQVASAQANWIRHCRCCCLHWMAPFLARYVLDCFGVHTVLMSLVLSRSVMCVVGDTTLCWLQASAADRCLWYCRWCIYVRELGLFLSVCVKNEATTQALVHTDTINNTSDTWHAAASCRPDSGN